MSQSKYASVITKLPRLPSESKFQDRVAERKTTLAQDPLTPAELAHRYREARAAKDELDDQASVVNLEIEALSQLLADAYEEAGLTSVRLEDGSSVSVQLEPCCQVEDREAFRLWCLANGYERSMTLPYMTANAIVKEALLKGEPGPDGVSAYARTKLVLRK